MEYLDRFCDILSLSSFRRGLMPHGLLAGRLVAL